LKATFFIFSNNPNENEIVTLVADGQEIASSGIADQSLTGLTSEWQDHFLDWSQSDLQAVTGQEITTFAYPRGDYNADIIANTAVYYLAARTADTASPVALNVSSPNIFELEVIAPNDTGQGDSNVIGYLQDSVDLAVAQQKWAIQQFHAIGVAGGYDNVSAEAFGAHLDYLVANESDLWVAPMGTVAEYIYERDAASITTLFQDSSIIQLDLQSGLDGRFNTPLTLLTDYPLDWEYGEILVTQPGQTDQIAAIISAKGSYYIMYDAVPEGGTVELSLTPLDPIDFTVTASADINGSIDPAGDITTPWGSDLTFTAIPDPNYMVDQWLVDGVTVQSGGSNYALTQIRADQSVLVTFKPYWVTVADWQGDKKGAVSITFDDGTLSQYENAFPLLQQYDLKGTFFIVTDYMGGSPNIDEWHLGEYVADGQEIGSHTTSHPHLPDQPSWFQESELKWSQRDLQDLTGQDIATLAYPYGDYDPNVIDLTDDYYIAARGVGSWFNEGTGSISLNGKSPNFYELEIIAPHDNGTGDPNVIAYLNYAADRAVSDSKWAIEMLHSIGFLGGYDNVSTEALGAHMDYLVANEPNVWVAPMGVVAKYIYERDAASVTTLISDSDMIRLDLYCGLDNRFDTPLTLVSPCPDGWESGVILVKQGLTEQIVDVVSKNGSLYMMYNAMPDAGVIELSPGRLAISASAGANGSIDPLGEFLVDYGSSKVFTATADTDYEVDQWSVDGLVVQTGGTAYTLSNITDDHTVTVTFRRLISISGQILSPAGASLPAVSVTAESGGEGLTDPNGYYQLTVGYNWTGRVVPSKQDYVFEPNNLNYVDVVTDTVGDYTGRHITDLLADGVIDGYDLEILCENWLAAVPFDIDIVDDGQMDLKDFSIFAEHWLDEYGNSNLVTHFITASAGLNGAVDPNGVVTVDQGTDQLFTATPDAGFEVDQWLLDGSPVQTGGTPYTLTNITADHTVSVTFKPLTYTVTSSAGANGTVDPSGIVTVDHGTDQLFTATPDAGFEVDQWLLDGSPVQTGGTSYTLSTITAAHTVSVTFKPLTYTVTSSAGSNGTVDPNGILTVDHDSGSRFRSDIHGCAGYQLPSGALAAGRHPGPDLRHALCAN
jgi:peptidoglycan/xylan/chitin deacetylase (PgdA/CDA1 family)